MVPKEKQYARSWALVPFDANHELTRLENTQPNVETSLPKEDNNIDECSKILFPEVLAMVGGEGLRTKHKDEAAIEHMRSPEALEKQDDVKEVNKHNDDSNAKEGDNPHYSEEEDDPDYVYFLEHLKCHEESYMLEYEEDGVPVVLKCEEDIYTTSACTTSILTHKKSSSMAQDASSVGSSATELELTPKKSRSMAQYASFVGSSATENLKRAKTRKQ